MCFLSARKPHKMGIFFSKRIKRYKRLYYIYIYIKRLYYIYIYKTIILYIYIYHQNSIAEQIEKKL
jgi:ABC-type long-subunit fatty acid transport system fused permease/ATPase subunit